MEREPESGLAALVGMRIDRIDMPEPDWVALSLRRPGRKEVLLARLSGQGRGLSLQATRPSGAPADGNVTKLRHHAGGRRIEAALGRADRYLDLVLAPVETRRAARLRLSFSAGQGNAIVLDGTGRVLCALRGVAPADADLGSVTTEEHPWRITLEALREAGAEEDAAAPYEDPTSALVKRRQQQLKRRLKAIQGDIDRGERAAQLRYQANLLVSQLHRLGPADKKVEGLDHEHQPPRPVTLFISAHLDARAQADAWFKQARRFERGVEIATRRRAETEALVDLCQRLLSDTEGPEHTEGQARSLTPEGRARAMQTLGIDAQEPAPPRKAKGREARRRPYRVFLGHGGQRILVGRGAADNDALTLHHAAPHDLWLHAHGAAGAHVVVPLDKGKTCPREVLVDAALLAAHFSRFKNDAQVEVDYTAKRYVRKPKGSPAGRVRVDQAQVILVKLDRGRLKALITSELGGSS